MIISAYGLILYCVKSAYCPSYCFISSFCTCHSFVCWIVVISHVGRNLFLCHFSICRCHYTTELYYRTIRRSVTKKSELLGGIGPAVLYGTGIRKESVENTSETYRTIYTIQWLCLDKQVFIYCIYSFA
jgi:hypothetical protein